MNPSLDNGIRERLASYLLGEYSLEDFKDWFVHVLLDIDHSENKKAINMAYEIELRLAEYSNGYWNEDELRNLFRPLVDSYNVNIDYTPNVEMGSNARVESISLTL
jgi:hypothetical protein